MYINVYLYIYIYGYQSLGHSANRAKFFWHMGVSMARTVSHNGYDLSHNGHRE